METTHGSLSRIHGVEALAIAREGARLAAWRCPRMAEIDVAAFSSRNDQDVSPRISRASMWTTDEKLVLQDAGADSRIAHLLAQAERPALRRKGNARACRTSRTPVATTITASACCERARVSLRAADGRSLRTAPPKGASRTRIRSFDIEDLGPPHTGFGDRCRHRGNSAISFPTPEASLRRG